MHEMEVKSILSPGNGMNLFRGCEHGCIYCDSRSKCYGMEHAFEDIAVKKDALKLLERELLRRRTRGMIGTGAMSAPYIPLEMELGLMSGALELIETHGFGIAVQTKSDRILRDLPRYQRINNKTKAVIQMTLTTWDPALCRILEPNVCDTQRRLEVLAQCRELGIPTVVWLSPILPFLNDTRENVLAILEGCAQVGVRGILCFGMGLTLREGNREYFYACLDRDFPGLKQQYIRHFGSSYQCSSPRNRELMAMYHDFCESRGIMHDINQIFRYLRTFEEKTAEQMALW